MVTEATAASRAEVDTSRPFQSVREAVEVFGERRHAGGNGNSWNGRSGAPPAAAAAAAAASPSSVMLECLKKLEEDLAEAKGEVVELRQRQAQMEVAVSSLSVRFSKGLAVYSSLSKGKEVAVVSGREEDDSGHGHGRVRSDRWEWDDSRAEEWVASLEYLPSLSEALAIKMVEDDLGDRRKERKVNKKKSKKKAAAGASRAKKHKSGISLQLVGGMLCSKKANSR